MDLPSCYGQYWEGIAGSDCTKGEVCGELDNCLAKFATTTLMQHQRKLGKDATPEKLSELASVRPEAILLALNFQKNAGIVPGAVPANPAPASEQAQDSELPPPPEEPEPENVPSPPDGDEEDPIVKKKQKKSGDALNKSAAKNTRGSAKKAPPKSQPKAKAAPKKKAATKAKTASKSKKKASNPPVAGPAKRAKGSAGTTTATSVSVASAQGSSRKKRLSKRAALPVMNQPTRKWDAVHNKSRWERERERSPLIAALPLGMKLRRVWKGEETLTEVKKGYYLHNGTRYPTLNSVMVSIMGLKPYPKQLLSDGTRPKGVRYMTAWSAPRWFGLEKLLAKLGLGVKAKQKRDRKLKKKRSRK